MLFCVATFNRRLMKRLSPLKQSRHGLGAWRMTKKNTTWQINKTVKKNTTNDGVRWYQVKNVLSKYVLCLTVNYWEKVDIFLVSASLRLFLQGMKNVACLSDNAVCFKSVIYYIIPREFCLQCGASPLQEMQLISLRFNYHMQTEIFSRFKSPP